MVLKRPLPAMLLLPLAVGCLWAAGCGQIRIVRPVKPAATPVARGMAPSPRLIVGRVLAIDPQRQFAIVDVGSDAPAAALVDGVELTSRTLDLRETAQLRVSRYVRGHTLGTMVISGQPSPGDEVVWLAP